MLHKLKYAALVGLLLLAVGSCKREALVQPVPGNLVNSPAAQKVQQWLKSQPSVNDMGGLQAGVALPPHILLWGSTHYDKVRGAYWVPALLKANTEKPLSVCTSLLATADKQGNITAGQYVLIVPKRTKTDDRAAQHHNPVPLLYADADNLPHDFSGAVLYYNMAGQLTGSKVYSDGQLQPSATATLAARASGEGSPSPKYVLQNCENRMCIDWYWQTYIDGGLAFEEYIETTCGCVADGNGGGSGGGGNGTTTGGEGDENCTATCGDVNTLINNMSGMAMNQYSITTGGIMGPDANGTIRQAKTIQVDFYKLSFPLGYYAQFSAIFTGVVYKASKDDPDWKWESLRFVKTEHTDGTIPPCTEVSSSLTPAPIIFSADRRFAQLAYNYNVKADFVCVKKMLIHNNSNFVPAWNYDANWD